MGLFAHKSEPDEGASDSVDVASEIFDESYREELRQLGRDEFTKIIHKSAETLKQDIDSTMTRVADDLKEYMTKRLDTTIGAVNSEVTNQLNERVHEYNRLADEAHDAANDALTQSIQTMQEKYQKLSASLEQAVANQEVLMVTVFQDNRSRILAAQAEQDKLLDGVREQVQTTRTTSESLSRDLEASVHEQQTKLGEIYQENIARVVKTRDAQVKVIDALSRSTQALQHQYTHLSVLLDKSLTDQKAILTGTLNDHMARIVEHYLKDALGEQFDVQAQLPSILEQMEAHKEAMTGDINL